MSVSFPNYDSMIPSLQGVRLLKTTTPASLPCFVRQLLGVIFIFIPFGSGCFRACFVSNTVIPLVFSGMWSVVFPPAIRQLLVNSCPCLLQKLSAGLSSLDILVMG